MACGICGRNACCASFHSLDEQDRYAEVIEAFDRAGQLREEVRTYTHENDEEDEDEEY